MDENVKRTLQEANTRSMSTGRAASVRPDPIREKSDRRRSRIMFTDGSYPHTSADLAQNDDMQNDQFVGCPIGIHHVPSHAIIREV